MGQNGLCGSGTVLDDGRGCVGRQPVGDQGLGNLRQTLNAHVEHPGLPRTRQGLPVVTGLVVRQMAGQKHAAGCKVAVSQRNASRGGAAAGGCHTGHHLECNAGRLQRQHFLATTSEHIGVTTFEANDAQALARWLSRTEGHRYRLPTEAEWEYACRAGSRSLYPHGDNPQQLVAAGNTFDQAAAPLWPRWRQHALVGNDGYAFTAPVGRFAPNAFGLYDMLGNAWEWTGDWHGDTYYAESPRNDPTGPAEGSVRVRRGGSWHTWALYARCGYRNWNSPETRYTLVGMRLVREIAAEPPAR